MRLLGDCDNMYPYMLIHKCGALSTKCEREIYDTTWRRNKINCVDLVLLCKISGRIQSKQKQEKHC